MTKWFVIVAGPNGAGKSTFVATGVVHRTINTPEDGSFEILNPDVLARRAAGTGRVTDAINLEAAQTVEHMLGEAIEARRSIGVETVLSSPKYRRLVETALSGGYRLLLHFVVLARPDLHVGRVGQRIGLGGHLVPLSKILERYGRSLEQLPWFAKRADRVFIWDNSESGAADVQVRLLAEKGEDGWTSHADATAMDPRVGEALRKILAGED